MTDPNHIAEARKKVSRPQIREVFLRNGAVIPADRDDLPDYVYESVFELLEMAAPAVQREPTRRKTPMPYPNGLDMESMPGLVEALEMGVDMVEMDGSGKESVIDSPLAVLAAHRKGGE